MDTTELIQLLGIGVGGCVLVALIVGAVKLSNATDAIWPSCSTKYGLAFEEQKTGNALTAQRRVKSLIGVLQGVQLRVVSIWELVGNTRRSSTRFHARSLYPAPHRFSLHIARGNKPGPRFHVVPTGDPTFDRAFSLRSDSPDLVRAFVNPSVQAAIRELPMNEVELAYDNGELCLSYGGQPFKQAELEAPIGVVVALGLVRLT
jgi:hypothetical protein